MINDAHAPVHFASALDEAAFATATITAVPAQHGVAATADPDVGRWKVLSWLLFRYLPLATHEQVLEEVATRRIEVHDA